MNHGKGILLFVFGILFVAFTVPANARPKKPDFDKLFYQSLAVGLGGSKTAQPAENHIFRDSFQSEYEFGVNLFELWKPKDMKHRAGVSIGMTNSRTRELTGIGRGANYLLPSWTVDELEILMWRNIPYYAEWAMEADIANNNSTKEIINMWEKMAQMRALKYGDLQRYVIVAEAANYLREESYKYAMRNSPNIGLNYHFMTDSTFDPYVGIVFTPISGKSDLPTRIRTGFQLNMGKSTYALVQVESNTRNPSKSEGFVAGYAGVGFHLD